MAIAIALGPRSNAFFDELTKVHLTRRKPRAKVPKDADLTNVKRAISVGTIDLVEGSLESEPIANEAPQEEPTEESAKQEKDLESMKKAELVNLAKEQEIEGYTSMTKAELVEALKQ